LRSFPSFPTRRSSDLTTFGFFNRLIDDMRRYLVFFGTFHQTAQREIAVRVRTPAFGTYVYFACKTAIDLSFGGRSFGHGFFAIRSEERRVGKECRSCG